MSQAGASVPRYQKPGASGAMAGEGRLFGADLLRAAVLAILTLGQVAWVSARQLSVVTVAWEPRRRETGDNSRINSKS